MPSLQFLSEEWFARGGEILRSIDAGVSGASARIQYQAGTDADCVRWHQVIDAGIVTAWRRGEIEGAGVEIRWSREDAFAVLSGERTSMEATLLTTIVDRRPDGVYQGPPPPLDLAREPALTELRKVPGANLVFSQEQLAGPFGDAISSQVFVDGQLDALVAGWVGEPGVVLQAPFRQFMRFRRAEISMLDLLQYGNLSGSIETLTFLAGIVESPSYQRAMRSSAAGTAPMALAALGEVAAQDGYRTAMASLFADTHPDDRRAEPRPAS